MKLTLIRHGETEWNRVRKLQGQKDISLSLYGIQQAHTCSKYLANENFDAVYSSPLSRAYRTAEIICTRKDNYIRTLDILKEIHMGEWEGMFWSEIQKTYSDLLIEFEKARDLSRVYKGESFEEVQERAISFLNFASNSTYNSILAVSHGILIKTLICHVLGLDLSKRRNFDIHNLSITTLTYTKESSWVISSLNEHSYLDNAFSNNF